MRFACLLLLIAASPAWADDDDDKAKPITEPEHQSRRLDHDGQFGLSVRFADGVRAVTTYEDSTYCGKSDATTSSGYAPVCVGRTPFQVQLEASYGVKRKLDVFAELRLGIEADFGASPTMDNGPHIVSLSPGLRVFYSEGRQSKLFSTAQLLFDFSSYKDASGIAKSSDFGVRNLNGLWFELDRSYAAYVYVGETLTFVRWLDFSLEAGAGFQVRY